MRQKSDEIKNRILKAAELEFSSKGFSGTTTRQLAKRAQVSYGNMYKYFQNKDELLEAVIGEYAKGVLKNFRDIMEKSLHQNPDDHHVELMVNALVALYEKSPVKFMIFLTGMEESKLYQLKVDLMESLKQRIYVTSQSDLLSDVLTDNLINAFIRFAGKFEDITQFKEIVQTYLRYHISGMLAVGILKME